MAPPTSLHWLTSLKSSQLKTLAAATGINSSGTKATLVAALQTHLPQGFLSPSTPIPPPPPTSGAASHGGLSEQWSKRGPQKQHSQNHEIISIDMGIRNLAYCRITLPASWPSSSPRTRGPKTTAVPTISDWARIAVSSKTPAIAAAAAATSTPSASKRKPKKGESKTKLGMDSESDSTSNTILTPPTQKEAFDPSTFSQHAYNLITHLLGLQPHRHQSTNHESQDTTQRPPPTQILIERQRFRSMGGSAVQEWTLRVNMFEAMLHAVLKTLYEQGQWIGSVHAVAPGKIGRFWLGDGDSDGNVSGEKSVQDGEEDETMTTEARKGNGKSNSRKKQAPSSKSAKTKTAKIRIVQDWLEEILSSSSSSSRDSSRETGASIGNHMEEGRFNLEGSARELGEAFLRRRKGVKDVKVRQRSIVGATTGGSEEEADVEADLEVEIGKLDDLADCVLQGMAWVQWEGNRRKIVEGGESALNKLS